MWLQRVELMCSMLVLELMCSRLVLSLVLYR